MPVYLDHAGLAYNYDGEPVAPPAELSKWQTDELLPLRCPHPPTACKMATLIRQVKADKDSIGGTVACVLHNVRLPPRTRAAMGPRTHPLYGTADSRRRPCAP